MDSLVAVCLSAVIFLLVFFFSMLEIHKVSFAEQDFLFSNNSEMLTLVLRIWKHLRNPLALSKLKEKQVTHPGNAATSG